MSPALKHTALFLVTLITTSFAGYLLFGTIGDGLLYSSSLILILGTHEMGHYLCGRKYGVNISLPYFIPAPSFSFLPTLGTFGAFIKMRSPISTKRALFDVGIAGPIAGLVVAIAVTIAGIKLSSFSTTPVGGFGEVGVKFGLPPLYLMLEHLFSPSAHAVDTVYAVRWHPFAFAGWIGMLVTALNLIPAGQLDGGHIVFSVLMRKWHRRISLSAVILLLVLGIGTRPIYDIAVFLMKDASPMSAFKPLLFDGWLGWVLWAAILSFIGRRHPPVFYDDVPLGWGRRVLAVVALIMFILCFTPVPISL